MCYPIKLLLVASETRKAIHFLATWVDRYGGYTEKLKTVENDSENRYISIFWTVDLILHSAFANFTMQSYECCAFIWKDKYSLQELVTLHVLQILLSRHAIVAVEKPRFLTGI